jgi:hypothetical protein
VADLHVLPAAGREKPDLHDVPLMLRRLADDLEAGKYGDLADPEFIIRCVCVLRVSGSEPLVMGWGATADLVQAYMDLHAGVQKLMSMQSPAR